MDPYLTLTQVNCVAFSPDYEIMVTGSHDERVRIFNAVSGELVCKLKGHTGKLYELADHTIKEFNGTKA